MSGKENFNPSKWAGRMKDIPVFLLGNGPSLKDKNLSVLDDFFTIGINRIFFMYEPTILLWQDLALWQKEKEWVQKSNSIKYARTAAEGEKGVFTFRLEGKEPRIAGDPSVLYGRGSSGSLAFQLACALGCNPIVLLGMDCQYVNGLTDFYGKNPMHRRHTLTYCEKALRFIKDCVSKKTIINCSENKVFSETKTIEEAVQMCGEKRYTKNLLKNMLLSD